MGLFILLFPVCSFGQSISLSPMSFHAWGKTPSMSEFSVEYKNFGVHYFHNWREKIYKREGVTRSSFALSYSVPVEFTRVGVLYFSSKYPIDNAVHLNFFIDVGFWIDDFRFSYKHVSNGFGLRSHVNPGVDFITIKHRITVPDNND